MAGRIVLTRPRAEAEAMAAELMARGYDTLVEPMLEIVRLPTPIPDLGGYRALIFTSANGVRSFAERSSDRSLPAYAVGVRTADTLRKAGFNDVRGAAGDAGLLAEFIRETLDNEGPVLHLAGKDVARDLEPLLGPAGITVDCVALYDAVAARDFSRALVDALYACTIESVLFFSVRTAAIFGTLLQQHGLAEMITPISALCLSSQVAAEAGKLPWRTVMVAPEHSAQSLIALLPRTGASGRGTNGRGGGRGA
jgi:uroporphyrinogen-III synthase